MADLLGSFLHGAMVGKLNRNHREMKEMNGALVDSFVGQLKAQKTIEELDQKAHAFEISLDKLKAHNEAEAARSAYLMDLLDQAYGGAENNPARQVAHPDQDFRIPSGDRKGEAVTKADEVYLNRFANVYAERYAKKWGDYVKDWVDFIHTRISF
jgi:hypothetical protein